MGCLYKLTFPNGKAYIGITSRTAARRFAEHRKSAASGKCLAVNSAISKYGADAVKIDTLVVADWEYLVQLEPRAIEFFGTKGEGGYNMTLGGEGAPGLTVSDETRERLRVAQTGKKLSEDVRAKMSESSRARVITDDLRETFRRASLGRKNTPEAIEKTRLANIGRKMSPELVERLREINMGRVKTASETAKISAANLGRVMTDAHKERLSRSATGRVMSKESIEKQWATRRANAAK